MITRYKRLGLPWYRTKWFNFGVTKLAFAHFGISFGGGWLISFFFYKRSLKIGKNNGS